MSALLCRLFGHRWKYWPGGHVYAGDDWEGQRYEDGTPYAPGFYSCQRCGETK